MFQKSYKDYIHKLNEKNKIINDEKKPIYTINHLGQGIYEKYIIDVSPIDHVEMVYWFKKSNVNKHVYVLDLNANMDNKQSSNILNVISSIYPDITEDFLTGCYIAKVLIAQIPNARTSFHVGCHDEQMIRGIESIIKTKWQWFGTDTSGYNDHYIRGITKNGDITKVNTLKSIRIQLHEQIDKLTFYISDVRVKHIYNMLIIALMDVHTDGFSIIRMPHVETTQLLNWIILVKCMFKKIKIFKTPWNTTKYYIICIGSSCTLAQYTTLLTYITETELNPQYNLFNLELMESEEIKAELDSFCNLFNELMKENTCENEEEFWLKNILN